MGGQLERAIGREHRPNPDQPETEAMTDRAAPDLASVYRPEAKQAFDLPLAFPVYLQGEIVRMQRSVPFSCVGPI